MTHSDDLKGLGRRGEPVVHDARVAEKALLARNAAWNIARYIVNWAVLIVLPPFIIGSLGTGQYAVWALILQVAAYHGMVDVHLQSAVARFVAQSVAADKGAQLGQTIASILVFFILLSMFALAPAGVVSFYFGDIFTGIPKSLVHESSISSFIVLISLAVTWPMTVMTGTFLGMQQNKPVTIAIVTSRLCSSVLMILCVYAGGGLISLALCYALGNLMLIAYYVRKWATLRGIKYPNVRRADPAIIASFARYCGSSAILAFSSMLLLGLALPIIGAHNFSDVTPYSLAIVCGNLLLVPQSAILWVALPRLAERGACAAPSQMGRSVLKFSRLAAIPLIGLSGSLIVVMPHFLPLWVGHDLAVKALTPAVLLIVAQFITLTLHPYRVAVSGTGEQLRTTPAIVVEGVCNAILSLLLVGPYGAAGVAAAACLGSMAGVAGHMAISLRLTSKISLPRLELFWVASMLPFLAILPSLLAFWAVLYWQLSLFVAAPLALAAPLAGIALFACIVLTADDRDDIRRTMAAFVRR